MIKEEGPDVIVLAAIVPAAGLMLLLGMDQLETRLLRPDPASRPSLILMPSARNTSSNSAVNLLSRSRMMNLNDPARSPRSINRSSPAESPSRQSDSR